MTTAYKSKVVKFKLDDDLLQSRIYFLFFIEPLEMIFSQYKENCEVLLDYPKVGEEDITYFVKKSIRNLLRANIDVHNRRLIGEFPGDRVKFIAKLQSHCANTTFAYLSRYDITFEKVANKGGYSAINYINRFKHAQVLSVSVRNNYSED